MLTNQRERTDETQDKDTFIVDGNGNTNYENIVLQTGHRPANNYIYRTLIQFDLTGIPADATITEATLYLYHKGTNEDLTGENTISAHQITENWTAGTATWNNKPAIEEDSEDTEIVTGNIYQWQDWDLTELTQKWIEGSQPNYGICLKQASETPQVNCPYFDDASSETSDQRPKIYIKWYKKL